MVYMLDFGRPFGMEPKIYLKRPTVQDNDDNPFGGPNVEEFDNVLEARRFS